MSQRRSIEIAGTEWSPVVLAIVVVSGIILFALCVSLLWTPSYSVVWTAEDATVDGNEREVYAFADVPKPERTYIAKAIATDEPIRTDDSEIGSPRSEFIGGFAYHVVKDDAGYRVKAQIVYANPVIEFIHTHLFGTFVLSVVGVLALYPIVRRIEDWWTERSSHNTGEIEKL